VEDQGEEGEEEDATPHRKLEAKRELENTNKKK
jgi:hypothetical protein